MRALVTGLMRLHVNKESPAGIPYSTTDDLAVMVHVRDGGAYLDVGAEEEKILLDNWRQGKTPGIIIQYFSATGAPMYAMGLNPAYDMQSGVSVVRRCALLGSPGRQTMGRLVDESRALKMLCANAFSSADSQDLKVVVEDSAAGEVGEGGKEAGIPLYDAVKTLLDGAGLSVVHISDTGEKVHSGAVTLMCMAWLLCLVDTKTVVTGAVDLTGEEEPQEEPRLFRPMLPHESLTKEAKREKEREKRQKYAEDVREGEYPDPMTLERMGKLLARAASKKKKHRDKKHPMGPGTEFSTREEAESVMAAWAEHTQKRVKIHNGGKDFVSYRCALCKECKFRVTVKWQIKSKCFRVSSHMFHDESRKSSLLERIVHCR